MPRPTRTIAAPPSADYAQRQHGARVKALLGKAASARSAAETKELVDGLVALLPPGVLG